MNIEKQLLRAENWGAEDQANNNPSDMVRESREQMANDAGYDSWAELQRGNLKLRRKLWNAYLNGRKKEKESSKNFGF